MRSIPTYWHLLRLHLADGQPVDAWERRGVVALSLRRLLDQQARPSGLLA
jgi:hypothetical protein